MPSDLSNYIPKNRGNEGGAASPVTSGGGYYVAPARARGGSNDLVDAYRNLRQLQGQRTYGGRGGGHWLLQQPQQVQQPQLAWQPQEEQQGQQAQLWGRPLYGSQAEAAGQPMRRGLQQPQTPAFQPPDTTGWREMTGAEKSLHDLAETGESISDVFGYGKKWEQTKREMDAGTADVGDFLETGARFIGSLPGGMVGGLMGAPEKLAEWGTGANLAESYDGKVSNVQLTDEQRWAQLANAGIDIVGMIPGAGIAGTAAKVGGQLLKGGIRGIGKKAAEEGAEQLSKGAFNKSWGEKLGEKLFPDHPFAAGAVGSMMEESSQEFGQSFLEDIRGDMDLHGFEAVTGENFDKALSKATESAAFGALGGAAFHTGATFANKGLDILQDEARKRGWTGAPTTGEIDRMVTEAKNAYASTETPREQYASARDQQVAEVVARDIETKMTKNARRNLGYSGTMVGSTRAHGNYMVASSVNVMATVNHNSTKDVVLNHIFGAEDGEYAAQRAAFVQAASENDVAAATDVLNDVARDRHEKGRTIEGLFYKQPATNETPIKGYITEFTSDPNVVEVDQIIAAIANADYDGDLAAMMFDPKKLKEARLLSESLVKKGDDGAPASLVNWGDAEMDIDGWNDSEIKLLEKTLEGQFGQGFADGLRFELPGADRELTFDESLRFISGLNEDMFPDVDEDVLKAQRHLAQAQLYTQLDAADFDISDVWRYVQAQGHRRQEIVSGKLAAKARARAASKKVADAMDNKVRYTSQTAREQGAFVTQAAPWHDRLVTIDMVAEAREKYNSVFRETTKDIFATQGTEANIVTMEGDTLGRLSLYEQFILANCDMVLPGVHDNSKIMRLYNSAVRAILDRAAGGEFRIDRDFDPDAIFTDDVIEQIEAESRRYNDAIQEMFFGGLAVPEGDRKVYLKQTNITRADMPEVVCGAYKNDYSLAELLEPLIDENPELKSIRGIYDGMDRFFRVTQGTGTARMLYTQPDSNAKPNAKIGEFVQAMKEAHNDVLRRQNQALVNMIAETTVYTKEEVERKLRSIPEDQRTEIMDMDISRAYNRLAELVGSDVLVANALARQGDWARYSVNEQGETEWAFSEDAEKFMYGSESDKKNAFWNLEFRTHTKPLLYRLDKAYRSGDLSDVRALLRYMNEANKNANPLFDLMFEQVELMMEGSGVLKRNKKQQLFLDHSASSENIKAAMANGIRMLSDFASYDRTVEQKIEWLEEGLTPDTTGVKPDLPWFLLVRAGMEEEVCELGISQKIAQARAVSAESYVDNMNDMLRQVRDLRDYIAKAGLDDTRVAKTLEAMASNVNVEIDPEITTYELFSTMIAQRPAQEKAQNVEAMAEGTMAKRMQCGYPFVTMFAQNTDALGDAVNSRTFCNTRRLILGCLMGQNDPVTGEPMERQVYNTQINDYVPVNQATMLGLAAGEKPTTEKIMSYLMEHPNVASWFKPMKLQMARVGSTQTVGPRAEPGDLVTHFRAQLDALEAPDVDKKNGTYSQSDWGYKEYRHTILEGYKRTSFYDAFIIACIPDLEAISTPQEFRRAVEAVRPQVDDFLVYAMFKSDSKEFQEEFEVKLDEAEMDRLQMIFEVTRDEEVSDSLLAEQTRANTRRRNQMNQEMLLASWMSLLDKDASELSEDAFNASGYAEELQKDAVEASKMLIQEVVMNRLLISNGSRPDPFDIIKSKMDWDSVAGNFKDPGRAKDVYEKLSYKEVFDKLKTDEFDPNELMSRLAIDENVFFEGEDRTPRDADEVKREIKEYACDGEFFAVEPSFIVDQIWPEVDRICAAGADNVADDVLDLMAKVHRKVAIEYYRGEAARRNKAFAGESAEMMREIIGKLVPTAKDIILREYDPDFFSPDKTSKVRFPKVEMPQVQFFNPVTARAMLKVIDYQTSGDAEMSIGMNGQTPKFLSFLGFLKEFSCNQGDRMKVADLANLDLSDETRYAVLTDEDTARKVTGFDGRNRFDLTPMNLAALSAAGVDPAQEVVVIDRDDSDACTTGVCCDHANGLIEFVQRTMAFSQESRTMKLKKMFRIIEDVVKGSVDRRTVVRRVSLSQNLSPQRIVSEYDTFIGEYVDAIRENAVKGAFTQYGDIDAGIWCRWAEPFAKMMVPCVKVYFKNGDTCSLSITALHQPEVKDPLWDPNWKDDAGNGMTSHQENIDWDQVASVDIRIMGAEEVSSHVINDITKAEVAAANAGTTMDYAAVAYDSFANWRSHSRYCQETFDKTSRLTVEDVVNSIGFLNNSMYSPPVLNVLPSTVARYLGTTRYDKPMKLQSRTIMAGTKGRDGRDEIHQSDIEALKQASPLKWAYRNSTTYISRFLTDKESDTSGSPYLGMINSVNGNRASRIAAENNGYLTGSTVLVDYRNNRAHTDAVRNAFARAAECDAFVMIKKNDEDWMLKLFGLAKGTVESVEVKFAGSDFVAIRAADVVNVRNHRSGGRRMQMQYGESDPYRVFANIPGWGPTNDSFIGMWKEVAEQWKIALHNWPVEFELLNLNGRKPAIVDTQEELRVVETAVADILAKGPQVKTSRSGGTPNEAQANRDLPPEALRMFDLRSATQGENDISDYVLIDRVRKYLEKVKQTGDIGVLTDVQQGDVIALAKTGDGGNAVYMPIVYQGAVPVSTDKVQIDVADGFTGSTFTYHIQMNGTMADGGAFKQYMLDTPGGKAMQAMMLDFKAKMAHKGIDIPISGLVNPPSMPGRLTPALEPAQVKLTLFVILRQKLTYDKLRGVTRDKVNAFFEGDRLPDGFTGDQVYDALTNKSPVISAVDEAFWRSVAAGKIKIKGVTGQQQVGIGRMILAFLNAGTSPGYLFSSRDSDGNWDQWSSQDWTPVLSEMAGVRLDDVMAFCSYVDPLFCPQDSRTMSDEEFDASPYLFDGRGRTKFAIEKDNGEVTGAIGGVLVTRTASNGTTLVGRVSDAQSYNSQLQFLSLLRNGPFGCDCKAAMQGMREYLKKFDDDQIDALYESDPDIIFRKLVDPQQPMTDIASYRPCFTYRTGNRSLRTDRWRENIKDFFSFYNEGNTIPEVWDNKKDEARNIDKYYDEARALYGGMTKKLYMRIIMANCNWTHVSSKKASGKMPLDVFLQAHAVTRSKLKAGKLPLVSEELQIDGNTKRIAVGAIEPWYLHDLCNVMGLKYSAARKQVRENLKTARVHVGNLVSSTSERRNQEQAVEYLEYMLDGFTDTAFLGSLAEARTVARDVTPIHDYIFADNASDISRFRKHLEDSEKYFKAIHEGEAARNRIRIETNSARAGTVIRNRQDAEDATDGLLDGAVKMQQAMAMAGVVLPVANILDTFKGNAWTRVGNYFGRQVGVGPYGHTWKRAKELVKLDPKVIELTAKDKGAQRVVEARMIAQTMGPEGIRAFDAYLERPGSTVEDYIRSNKGKLFENPRRLPHRAFTAIMRFGGGARFNMKSTTRNFLENFQRLAGERGLTELSSDGQFSLERELVSENGAAQAINNLFKGPYAKEARDAWNMTMSGPMAQETMWSFFGEAMTQNRSWMRFVGATCCGVKFYRATVNLTMRTLKNVLPGISTLNYVMTDMLQRNPDVFNSDGPLGMVLRWVGNVEKGDDAVKFGKEFEARADAFKLYVNLREAILVDLMHMTLPMFGFVLALCGAVQPPEDDEMYDDYEEWTVFGQRISLQWWVKDLVGPILPWTCYIKSCIDERPSSGIMTNGLCDFINMSPYLTMNNAMQLVLEPDSALEAYEETKDWYSDSRGGAPELFDYLSGSAGALTVSFLASLVTPRIVTDISQYMMPYEVSYNRRYAVDETGQPLYEPDGVTLKTEKVPFAEAQMRKLTRNNFLLGGVMDALSGVTGNPNAGWTAAEMPRQVVRDSAQMECMKALSVWDYERDVPKDPDEIAEVCTAIVLILDQSDDMDALYHEGFYLDSYTKQAVSEYIWDLHQQEVNEWSALVQSGATDYLVAGNGDWGEGQKLVEAMKQRHYDILSYYKDELYYGKLRSSELNQGLIQYNRYNTTYRQDASGDWYATGLKQNQFPLLPVMYAPQDGTAGVEGSWATESAVTGLGMYDDKGDPMRALEAVPVERDQWLDWEQLGGGNANGMSNAFVNWDPDAFGTSGSTGYKYPSYGYRRSYGGGGYGYGGYSGGYKGYSRSYGSNYVRHANVNRGQGGYVPKAPYVNTHRSTRAHSINFNDPNFSNVLDARKIYTANLDYLRPDFETKGSREAYKRGDF